jgi:hypothetical protein
MRQAVRRLLVPALVFALVGAPGAASSAPKEPPPTGALAYHRDSGSFGYAVNARDSRSARIAALNQCGHPKCEIVVSLSKDCGAVANGAKRFSASRGVTRQEAQTRALRQCGDGCEIVGWACPR